jgi:hypothetical protein
MKIKCQSPRRMRSSLCQGPPAASLDSRVRFLQSPASPVSGVLFRGGGESPTFPQVRPGCPRSAISGISVRAGRAPGAGLCSPYFNFHFGGAETGSMLHERNLVRKSSRSPLSYARTTSAKSATHSLHTKTPDEAIITRTSYLLRPQHEQYSTCPLIAGEAMRAPLRMGPVVPSVLGFILPPRPIPPCLERSPRWFAGSCGAIAGDGQPRAWRG